MSSTKCRIEHGNLLIISEDTGLIIWKGKPNGIAVSKFYKIENTDDHLVLLDKWEAWKNNKKILLRINQKGEIVWEVESPQIGSYIGSQRDAIEDYSDVTSIGEKTIKVWASSCYSDEIDINTGKIIHSVFTK